MTEGCYCYFDESYANDHDYDYHTDVYDDEYYDDYETDVYNDQEQEVFLTNTNNPKKDWFCCNCYNLFETKSECLKHEKMCMKLL
jgi:hypothetical protein